MAEGGVKDRAGGALTRAKRRIGLENPSAADDDGNVGIVRGALRALGEGNLDEFCEVLKSDVTWEAPGGNFVGDEALNGRDEVRKRFLGDAGRTFTKFGFKPEKFLDADDENAVIVLGTFMGEGAEGDTVDEPSVMVFQFSGSEVDHVRIYTDSAKWPEPITEERERQLEEEEKKKEEEEKKKEEEAKGEGDSASDDDSEDSDDSDEDDSEDKQPESKSDDDSDDSDENENEKKESESKSEGDSEG